MHTTTTLFTSLLLVLAFNLTACGQIPFFSPTNTPTPSATPTPTLTPTASPTPTITPSPTPTPLPDLSTVLLTLHDLPDNFIEMPPSQVENMTQGMEGFGFSESVAAGFTDKESGETVGVITGLLLDKKATNQFQEVLSAPDVILNGVLSNMGTNPTVKPGQLAGVANVGDQATAVTGTVNMQGISVRVDSVLVKRGTVGIWAFSFYQNGAVPTAPIIDLAKIVDGRIINLIGAGG